MIDKREIIDGATALSLNPHITEKGFFETYRFSEDLDFTLTDPSHINTEFLETVFAEIGKRIYEETGIELPIKFQQFEIYDNPRGRESCQGRIGYQGPISPRGKSTPRIKLDLTADECVVSPPVQAPVFHPYSDVPDGGIIVQSYAYEEAFAEKIRALAERTRPRDLYDVINMFRHADARPTASVLLDVLRQKCDFKGIALPNLKALEQHKSDLEGAWSAMLKHQLPALPPVPEFWEQLVEFFEWLYGRTTPAIPASYTRAIGEELIRERVLRLPVSEAVRSYLEIIRFAASNRLCVELEYQSSTRVIEPYSLRRSRAGHIILHAHNVDKNEHRSYRVERIQGARVTDKSFIPRFEIELTPTGPEY